MVRLCLSNWGSAEGLIKALPVPTDGLESWKQGVFSVCVYVKMLSVCVCGRMLVIVYVRLHMDVSLKPLK